MRTSRMRWEMFLVFQTLRSLHYVEYVLVGCGAAHPASSRGQIPKWLALAHWPWSPPHASSHAVPQRACDMARERKAQGERASPNDLEHGGFPVAPHAAPILDQATVKSPCLVAGPSQRRES